MPRYKMTRKEYIELRSKFAAEGITKLDVGNDKIEAYVYRSAHSPNRPGALVFTGKKNSPDIDSYFISEESMAKRIHSLVQGMAAWEAAKKERRKANQTPHNVKVGDIFYTSWGYEQTNVEFYQVKELRGTKTAVIQQIGSKSVTDSSVVAVKGAFVTEGYNSELMTRRISTNCGRAALKINSVATAWEWDGKAKYETPFGCGH